MKRRIGFWLPISSIPSGVAPVAAVAVVIVIAIIGAGVAAGQGNSACVTGGAVASGNPGLASDCETLLSLKDSLRGTATLNWSTDTPIASWNGITVGGSPQRVTKVKLQKKGLSGYIPAEIGSLAMLGELWLYTNTLTGTIPPEMGNLSNLSWLLLANNKLSGQIPEALNNLTLDRLWLQKNSFTGCVPYNLTLTREYKVDRGLAACAPPSGSSTPTPTPVAGTPTPTPTPVPGTTQTPTAVPGDTSARLTAIEGRLSDVERRVASLEADMARLLATPTPTPVPTPGATPTPTPTPTPTDLGTQQQPVPFGTAFTFQNSITDHWEFTVLETTPDATRTILDHNRFNDPPADGNQFYMVKVRAKYLGTASQTFDPYSRLKVLGNGGVVYTNNCAYNSIPDSIPNPELFKNGQIEGNDCWEIASSDADSLVLFVEPDQRYSGHSRFWFSLTPP